jgi:hypothetical protein
MASQDDIRKLHFRLFNFLLHNGRLNVFHLFTHFDEFEVTTVAGDLGGLCGDGFPKQAEHSSVSGLWKVTDD